MSFVAAREDVVIGHDILARLQSEGGFSVFHDVTRDADTMTIKVNRDAVGVHSQMFAEMITFDQHLLRSENSDAGAAVTDERVVGINDIFAVGKQCAGATLIVEDAAVRDTQIAHLRQGLIAVNLAAFDGDVLRIGFATFPTDAAACAPVGCVAGETAKRQTFQDDVALPVEIDAVASRRNRNWRRRDLRRRSLRTVVENEASPVVGNRIFAALIAQARMDD